MTEQELRELIFEVYDRRFPTFNLVWIREFQKDTIEIAKELGLLAGPETRAHEDFCDWLKSPNKECNC